MFYLNAVINIFEVFTGKTPVLQSLFNKVASLQACNFIKKRLQRKCFPVKLAKFQKHLFWRSSANDCFYLLPHILFDVGAKIERIYTVSSKMYTVLLKKRLWHGCFPVSFIKFLRTPFLQNTSGRLPLDFVKNNHAIYLFFIFYSF